MGEALSSSVCKKRRGAAVGEDTGAKCNAGTDTDVGAAAATLSISWYADDEGDIPDICCCCCCCAAARSLLA
jgi:hypothetical protein